MTESKKASSSNGWGFPVNARKAHYFVDGRSLCLKWLFFGHLDENQKTGANPGPDDCVTCFGRVPKPPEPQPPEGSPT